MEKKVVIAIDGVSSSGKSTMAKQIAKTLGFTYIDSGAMYRAVTLYFLENEVDIYDAHELQGALDNIRIEFKQINGVNTCYVNGINVEAAIRTMEVSQYVSQISAITLVRRKMVAQQQDMSKHDNIVMDGRDIGTVVFPDALVKLYIYSPARLRAERRWLEMKENTPEITIDEIENNLIHRDHIDSTREDSPLKLAPDAVFIDNTNLNVQEQYEAALQVIREKLTNP